MVARLEIPNGYLAAAPVIVTSPTTRCGTTLVQRLLCATDNAFIYGEEIGSQFRTLAALLAHQIRQCEQHGPAMDDAFSLAMAGGLRDWRPGLTPPAQTVLNAWTHAFYQLPASLADFGRQAGRPIWGFKWPGCPAATVRTFLTLMPASKVVFVMRNVVDALKSAKARRFVKTEDDAAAFCTEWARNMREFSALSQDPRVLIVRYEDLIVARDAQIRVLSDFAGAVGMRRSEFDLKVNTFEGVEAEGFSPTQYIPPATLAVADWTALRAQAGEVMNQVYPELKVA